MSGSPKLGTAGETLLFAACLLVGAATLGAILYWVLLPQWQVNRNFVESRCTVVAVPGAEARETSSGTVYRPRIPVEFVLEGVTYRNDHYDLLTWYADQESAEEIAAKFQQGERYPIWYDPLDPRRAVLVRGHTLMFWLLMLLPLAFLAIGVGGLTYNVWQVAISRERRAAIAQIASDIELFDESAESQPRFPSIPRDADVTNSPGTTLAYRLPIATLPSWRLFALTGTCLFWNSLVALLLFLAICNHLEDRPDWIMDAMTALFLVPGLWLTYRLIQQLMYASGIGMTRVEISQHPLEPGGRYEVYVSQGGRLNVKKFEVLLTCEEQA
ncbi:MAG: DUF3592 domain-containing protein, partial [Planctomycetales bacterium]|nr:DUF3592 domain-containing protein [Planctomycetales bacterium]